MAKGKKGADAGAEAAAAPAFWECAECGEQENGADDAACVACDAPRPAAAAAGGGEDAGRYAGYAVGLITTCEDVAGKDKLKKLSVDVGGRMLVIATNAPNVAVGTRVVVATVGSSVPDGSGGEVAVKKATVGGVISEGMLCDAPMLGWVGGGAGNAATVPDSFALGAPPPDKRPRMDGR